MNIRTRITAGLVAGGVLALAVPLAASAHVTVTPSTPVAGGYDVLTFAFSHGCDGSPTTAIRIDLPEQIASATPTITPGWDIAVERDPETALPATITYTATEPVADGMRAALEVGVKYADDASGTLAFPVEQVCAEGSSSWSEEVAEGADPHSVDYPAPTVTLAEGAAAAGHGDHEAAASEETDSAAADPLPVALGAGGLVAGIAALGVAIAAFRRTSRRA